MTHVAHWCAGSKGPGDRQAAGGWHLGLRLAAALLAVGFAGLTFSADASAQAKKKKEEAPPQQDTAAVQRAYAGGTKAFEAGDMAGAEQQLSVALSGGGLPNSQMARALYLRGAASRRLGKPAQAISDLTTAVWLKGGLSDADKAKANEERQFAYREAGLGDTPPPIGAAPLDQSTKSAAAPAATTATGAQVVQVQPQSFWNNFSVPSLPSLTGSSQPAAGAATTQTAESGQQSSFWSFMSPSSSPPADATAQAVAPAADGSAQLSVTQGPVSQGPVADASATAAASHSSWDTQTAAAAEASAAQQLSAGYASSAPSSAPPAVSEPSAVASAGYAPAPDTGLNPMSVPADASAQQVSLSNPLAGTGTAVSNFFGNVFGSGSSAGTEPQAGSGVTTGSAEHPGWGADTTVVTAQTSSMVQRGPDSPPPSATPDPLPWGGASGPAAAPEAAPVKVAAAGPAAGKYKLQVAAVRSREEAERLAQSLSGYQPVRDGMVSPEIDEAVIGSMGTFYRVRLGPYADAGEPNQLCKTLKPQGFDCLVVTQ